VVPTIETTETLFLSKSVVVIPDIFSVRMGNFSKLTFPDAKNKKNKRGTINVQKRMANFFNWLDFLDISLY
jgi:hypothetical protein